MKKIILIGTILFFGGIGAVQFDEFEKPWDQVPFTTIPLHVFKRRTREEIPAGAIHRAVAAYRLDLVKDIVLRYGPLVEEVNFAGFKPLNCAVEVNFLDAVKHLVKKGRDDISNGPNGNPLVRAAELGYDAIVHYLVERGVSIFAVNNNGKKASNVALDRGNSVLAEYLNTVELFLQACESGNLVKVKKLFEQDAVHKYLATSSLASLGVYTAIQKSKNNFELVKYLVIEKGADVNWRNYGDRRKKALHIAASRGNIKTIAFLIDRGASVNSYDNKNKTPLYYAVSKGKYDIATYLLDRGAMDVSSWGRAIKESDLALIEAFLVHGADLYESFESDDSVLHKAVFGNDLSVLKFLVLREADLGIRNDDQLTPLELAVEQGSDDEIVNYLRFARDFERMTEKKLTIEDFLKGHFVTELDRLWVKELMANWCDKPFVDYFYDQVQKIQKELPKDWFTDKCSMYSALTDNAIEISKIKFWHLIALANAPQATDGKSIALRHGLKRKFDENQTGTVVAVLRKKLCGLKNCVRAQTLEINNNTGTQTKFKPITGFADCKIKFGGLNKNE